MGVLHDVFKVVSLRVLLVVRRRLCRRGRNRSPFKGRHLRIPALSRLWRRAHICSCSDLHLLACGSGVCVMMHMPRHTMPSMSGGDTSCTSLVVDETEFRERKRVGGMGGFRTSRWRFT